MLGDIDDCAVRGGRLARYGSNGAIDRGVGDEHIHPLGELIPKIVLPDVDGQPITLGSFRDRKLLLFLWASW